MGRAVPRRPITFLATLQSPEEGWLQAARAGLLAPIRARARLVMAARVLLLAGVVSGGPPARTHWHRDRPSRSDRPPALHRLKTTDPAAGALQLPVAAAARPALAALPRAPPFVPVNITVFHVNQRQFGATPLDMDTVRRPPTSLPFVPPPPPPPPLPPPPPPPPPRGSRGIRARATRGATRTSTSAAPRLHSNARPRPAGTTTTASTRR